MEILKERERVCDGFYRLFGSGCPYVDVGFPSIFQSAVQACKKTKTAIQAGP